MRVGSACGEHGFVPNTIFCTIQPPKRKGYSESKFRSYICKNCPTDIHRSVFLFGKVFASGQEFEEILANILFWLILIYERLIVL